MHLDEVVTHGNQKSFTFQHVYVPQTQRQSKRNLSSTENYYHKNAEKYSEHYYTAFHTSTAWYMHTNSHKRPTWLQRHQSWVARYWMPDIQCKRSNALLILLILCTFLCSEWSWLPVFPYFPISQHKEKILLVDVRTGICYTKFCTPGSSGKQLPPIHLERMAVKPVSTLVCVHLG